MGQSVSTDKLGNSDTSPNYAHAHHRRVDPRWSRVTLEQLRDEEFLTKHLRRLEAIAGARKAATAISLQQKKSRDRRGSSSALFVQSTNRVSPWVNIDSVVSTEANDSNDKTVNVDTGKGTDEWLVKQASNEQEFLVNEDALLHSLCLLGDLEHPQRTGLLLCHLHSQLQRLCAVPDPIADLIHFRKTILRDVYDAVQLQHQHVRHTYTTLAIITTAFEASCASKKVSTNTLSATAKDKLAQEAVVGLQLLFEMISIVVVDSSETLKKELLYDIFQLLQTLPASSLAPSSRIDSNTSTSTTPSLETNHLVRKLQSFLLQVAVTGTTVEDTEPGSSMISPRKNLVSSSFEFDAHDRTSALEGLMYLAMARGSVSDFLLVVQVLLGIGNHTRTRSSSQSSMEKVIPVSCTNSTSDIDEEDPIACDERVDPIVGSDETKGLGMPLSMAKVRTPIHKPTVPSKVPYKPKAPTTTMTRRATPMSPVKHTSIRKDVLNNSHGNSYSKIDIFPVANTSSHRPNFSPLHVCPLLHSLDRMEPSSLTSTRHDPYRQNLAIDSCTEEPEEATEVWSCGQNSYGELGHGDTISRTVFTRIESLNHKEIIQVCAGNEHSIVLSRQGTVYTCGYNDNGQCGQGTTTRIDHMTPLSTLGNEKETKITQVHAYNGCEHTILITVEGRAITCGYNYRGQLGHGNTQSESIPKLLRSLEETKRVDFVSCSYYHTILTCGEDVYSFGRNDYGQLGVGDTVDRKTPERIEGITACRSMGSVACGQYHTLVATGDGELYSFGKNDYGQLGIASPENQLVPIRVDLSSALVKEVRCGYYHTIVLCRQAQVYSFGRNDYGQLGLGRASQNPSANALLQQQRFTLPQLVPDLMVDKIVQIACGCYHTIAVSESGLLYMFGRNNHGQLGTGDTLERLYPFPIDIFVGKRVAMVAAGFYHTIVLTGGREEVEDEDCEREESKREDTSKAELIPVPLVTTETNDVQDSMSCMTILSNPVVRRMLEPSNGTRSRKLSGIDPSDDGEGSVKETELSCVEAVDIAVIVLAQLDRLCSPLRPKRGVFPTLHPPVATWMSRLMQGREEEDVSTVVDGCFELCAIEVSSSTMESLCAMIDTLGKYSTDRIWSRSLLNGNDYSLPIYARSVCFRLLQCHIAQLLRTGLGALVLSTSHDVANATASSAAQREITALSHSFKLIRTTLLHLVNQEHLAPEAMDTLMMGFELLFPCPCTQLSFLLIVLNETGLPGPIKTCTGLRCAMAYTSFDPVNILSLRAKQRLQSPLLRRMSEDAVVAKLLPLRTPTVLDINDQNGIRTLYQGLFRHLREETIQEIKMLRPSSSTRASAIYSLLNSIQKHLAAWTSSCDKWTRALPTNSDDSLSMRVNKLVLYTFSIENQAEDLPLAWRALIDFVHVVIAHTSEVLVHALGQVVPLSPARNKAETSTANHSEITRCLENSCLNQLLPSTLACLHTFSSLPTFATSLVLPLTRLLQLIDDWNVLSRPLTIDTQKSVKRLRSNRELVKHSGSNDSIVETMALPWSDSLENELALVCTDMTGTILRGDALFECKSSNHEEQKYQEYTMLLNGGIKSDVLHTGVGLGGACVYCPVPDANLSNSFTLVIPTDTNNVDSTFISSENNSLDTVSIGAAQSFLHTMASISHLDNPNWSRLALDLCDRVRTAFGKTDASYRMLLRQTQSRPIEEQNLVQTMEAAFFASLLHHLGRGLMALQFAMRSSTIPPTMLQLWRTVAEMRKRFVAKRTAIKNTTHEAESVNEVNLTDTENRIKDVTSTRVEQIQTQIIERCQLLLLVNVDDEVEHTFYHLDGGFVPPYDSAMSFRMCSYTSVQEPYNSSIPIRVHINARYNNLPFLAAYPHSRWRRVRILWHVCKRWKATTRPSSIDIQIPAHVLSFVMSDDVHVGSDAFIYTHLLQPCRRLASATRGFEQLRELLSICSLDSIRRSIVQRMADILTLSHPSHSNTELTRISLGRLQFTNPFYRELCRNAQAKFLTTLTTHVVQQMEAVITPTPSLSISYLLVLLRCWSAPFGSLQFEFVNDVGIMEILQQCLSQPSNVPQSLRQVVWSLLRFLSVHFAAQPQEPSHSSKSSQKSTMVPIFPAANEVFQVLYAELTRLGPLQSSAQQQLQPLSTPESDVEKQDVSTISTASTTARRSVELINSPQRFSPFRKGIQRSYTDMTTSSTNSMMVSMSPLVKATELSVTAWIYVNASAVEDPTHDYRVVFLRGDDHELSPYVILNRDPETASFQLEVGLAFLVLPEHPSTTLPPRVFWERLGSKDSSFPIATWTHLAIVLEGAKLKLYINGNLDNQRTISAPHSLSLSTNNKVQLDFQIGQVSTPSSQFLASLFQRSSLDAFDGCLSRFRFHNRALSPIHVRVVFDEKKETLGSIIQKEEQGQQLQQLQTVLRILSEAGEGRIHLMDSKWIRHLWHGWVRQVEWSDGLSQTSLRLLQQLLPWHSPSVVAVAVLTPSSTGREFVRHVLTLIGSFLSPNCHSHVVKCPPMVTELQNGATAHWIKSEALRVHTRLSIANELVALLVHLATSSPKLDSGWRACILAANKEILQSTTSRSNEPELVGCLYFMSGSMETLRQGAKVQLVNTRECADIVAINEDTTGDSSVASMYATLSSSTNVSSTYDWYEQVQHYCGNPSKSQFLRLHTDDVVAITPPAIMSCLSHQETLDILSPLIQCSFLSEHTRKLSTPWQQLGFVIKALNHLTATTHGAHCILQEQALTQIIELSIREDGHGEFSTLQEIEMKLWIVRTRLNQLMDDLGEEGVMEMRRWMERRDSKHSTDHVPTSTRVSNEFESPLALSSPEAEGKERNFGETIKEMLGEKPQIREFGDDDMNVDVNDAVDNEEVDEEQEDQSRISPQSRMGHDVDDDEEEDDDDDDDDDHEEDGDEDEDEAEEEDDDEEEAAAQRQEFVDELMLMGFPEEWCTLALKQTENDIVHASAWIVDNLEYLNRLQTTLDKQRQDVNAPDVRYEEDADDAAEDGKEPSVDLIDEPKSSSHLCLDVPPHDSHGLVNDKEMGRKVFQEMYFPFEQGGVSSNTRHRLFFQTWRTQPVEKHHKTPSMKKMDPPVDKSKGEVEPVPLADLTDEITPPVPIECNATELNRFQNQLDQYSLIKLLEHSERLEERFAIVSARQLIVSLCEQAQSAEDLTVLEQLVKSTPTKFLTYLKLVLMRGEQFTLPSLSTTSPSSTPTIVSIERILQSTVQRLCLANDTVFKHAVIDFALTELEHAALNVQYESYLWSQRKLSRPDPIVLNEPSLELASWLLLDVVLASSHSLQSSLVHEMLRRLSGTLRSTNLPVKMVTISCLSRLLDSVRVYLDGNQLVTTLETFQLTVENVLKAAKQRFIRESVQHRTLYSLYLQSYIELLHILRHLPFPTTSLFDALPPPIPKSILDSSTTSGPLLFDRKKCHSPLLHLSEDGTSVCYSGNEIWKTVIGTHSYTIGCHTWSIRIDKTSSSYLFLGIATSKVNYDSFLGADDQSWGFIGDKALYYQRNRIRAYGETFVEGDIIHVDLDCDRGTLSFRKNDLSMGIAFDNVVGQVFPAVAFYSRHQKVTIISCDETFNTSVSRDETSIEECVVVCELMDSLIQRKPIRTTLVECAYEMTRSWQQGINRHVITRTGQALWVDTTKVACARVCHPYIVFHAQERVRTPRGNGVVLGVADNRLWVEVDGEIGAWYFDPSKLRSLTLGISVSPSIDKPLCIDETPSESILSFQDFHRLVHTPHWTLTKDQLLIRVINEYCEMKSTSPWNVSPSQVLEIVSMSKGCDVLTSDQHEIVMARFGLLRYINAYMNRVIGFFDFSWYYFDYPIIRQPCQLLSQSRCLIFTCIKNQITLSLMEKTANSVKRGEDEYDYPDDLPQMLINRPKAATAKCHPGTIKSLLYSMFGQAFTELHFLPLSTLRMIYSHPMDDGQLRSFKVKFEGEGVDDYGGPYREFYSQVFAELQMLQDDSISCFLPFFLPCPNWRNGVGSNREKFVLNGALFEMEEKRQVHAEMCHFLGQMIGLCLRTRVCIRLDLAISIWKQLVGQDCEWKTLGNEGEEIAMTCLQEIDYVAYTLLKTVRTIEQTYRTDSSQREQLEQELNAMELNFTTYLSDGRCVELCLNGHDKMVTIDTISIYIRAVLIARMEESRTVMNVIKQGIHSIIPINTLALFTWQELEKRVCGVAEVDIDLLQQNTEYDDDLSATDETIERFWRVLKAMDDEDRRLFLRFVWARSRLPVGKSQFHQKFKIQSLISTNETTPTRLSYNDNQLPKSHTCFFALQLPRYSSDEICRRQLLYAIHNCVEMDGDFRLADTEMTGWTDIDPNDQLRF